MTDAASYYARVWDDRQRDPLSLHGPAAVPMGRGFKAWQRFNPGQQLVWVDDLEGNPKAVTVKQRAVLELALSMVDGEMLSMRDMAERLKVSPSTVSRALTRLAAWGIIAYVVGRGRWAGLVIMRRAKGDGLDRFRRAAKDRVRRWKEAGERRISRLQLNVAPYFHEERKVRDSLYDYLSNLPTTKSATLKPWTAEDMAEVDAAR